MDTAYRFRVERPDGPWSTVLTSGPTELEAAKRAVLAAPLAWPRLTAGEPIHPVEVLSIARVSRFRPVGKILRRIMRPRQWEALVEDGGGRMHLVVLNRTD